MKDAIWTCGRSDQYKRYSRMTGMILTGQHIHFFAGKVSVVVRCLYSDVIKVNGGYYPGLWVERRSHLNILFPWNA